MIDWLIGTYIYIFLWILIGFSIFQILKSIKLFTNYRGYSGKKLEDNVQCEIFQTILDEAKGIELPAIY